MCFIETQSLARNNFLLTGRNLEQDLARYGNPPGHGTHAAHLQFYILTMAHFIGSFNEPKPNIKELTDSGLHTQQTLSRRGFSFYGRASILK